MNNGTNILVLGFYNRNNIGDEAYKTAFPILLNNEDTVLSFVCIDDIDLIENRLQASVHTVILGGGDIINEYFMIKVSNYLHDFAGRVYGISIGIPYASCSRFLHLFDYVIVRSTTDYLLACAEIGKENVLFCPDIATLLPHKTVNKMIKDKSCINIGVCLAQPVFSRNPNGDGILDNICKVFSDLNQMYSSNGVSLKYHILAFNQQENNETECDKVINIALQQLLVERYNFKANDIIIHNELRSPGQIVSFFEDTIDVAFCMRYHSVIFSLLTKTPFVPVYSSQKINNVLLDIEIPSILNCHMEVDSMYRPTELDSNKLSTALQNVINNYITGITSPPGFTSWLSKINSTAVSQIQNIVMTNRQVSNILVKTEICSFEDVLVSCRRSLCKYLCITSSDYDDLLKTKKPLISESKSSDEIARFICYIVSGQINHPCVWGLANNLRNDDFILYDAIKFVWDEYNQQAGNKNTVEQYYPSLSSFNRRVFVNIDYILSNDFSQYHRSGWSYVIGGLMNLDASHLLRQSSINIDTYVDRTFHWGYDILKTLGELPYTKPWYGFVHHVFDETHSEYNCVEMFKNEDFIKSLEHCKGLIALTMYLSQKLKETLVKNNINVEVYTLYHPMEFLSDDSMFSMEKFISNENKLLVQIGAWLRKPYSIYNLKLRKNSDLQFQKVALKGKEMDQYFPPPGFNDVIEEALLKTDWYHGVKHENNDVCRLCRDDHNSPVVCVCRPSKKNTINRFCEGLYDVIVDNNNSVEIINKLSNDEYDSLLSKNVVFLDLIDCSAVNTVIECIVRNTPLIVNRLPALEEVLGTSYPGFYENLSHASEMCSTTYITAIHLHLKSLDKTRYYLEEFIEQFQNIILSESQDYKLKEYNLFLPDDTTYLSRNAKWISRFLPRRYQ